MKRRIAAVLRSYRTRPWAVAGGLLYILLVLLELLIICFSNGPERLQSIFDNSADRIGTLNRPNELVAWVNDPSKNEHHQGISIGRRVFQSGPGMRGTIPRQNRSGLPNPTYEEMDAKSIESLQRLHSLRILELNAIKATPELWQAIGQLKELRYLRINSNGKVDIKLLPILPKLELLSLGSVAPNDLALLRMQPNLQSLELADADFGDYNASSNQLPIGATLHQVHQIRELIINPQMQETSGVVGNIGQSAKSKPKPMKPVAISVSLCNEIKQLPNLRLVSVGERGAKVLSPFYDPGLSHVVAGCAKSVVVNGRSTGPDHALIFFNLMLSILLLTIIGAQLRYQIPNSASLLLPKFIVPHLFVPVALVLSHVGLMTLMQMQVGGSHMIPAVAESCIIVCLFCLFASLDMTRVLTLVMSFAPFFLVQYIPALIERPFYRLFQIDEYPVLAISVLLVEMLAIAMVLVKQARSPKRLALQHLLDAETGMSLDNGRRALNERSSTAPNRLLLRLLASRPSRFKNFSIRLWNAGFEHRAISKFDWMALMPTTFILVFAISDGFRSVNFVSRIVEFFPAVLLAIGIYILFVKTFVYLSGMLVRQSLFEIETLLPMTKSGMRNIRLCGLWVDVWPWLMVSFCSAALGTIVRAAEPNWMQIPIGLIWLIFMHCLFSVFGVWSLCMLLLTVRSSVDKRMIAYPLGACWLLTSFFLVTDWFQLQIRQINGLELIAVVSPGVVGLYLVSIAWFRFPNAEWGNRSDH